MKYAIGIDIGGTKCAVILGKAGKLEKKYEIVDKTIFNTQKTGGPKEIIDKFTACIDGYLAAFGLSITEDIDGIGISCGGPLDSNKGMILSPPNLPGWDNIPITEILHQRYPCPVILQNDANAGAMAEWKYGAGRGCSNMIFLTFGTGLGAGLILDNRLYNGTNGMAGEVGHIRLSECGPVGYGKMGSFEGFCSGGGIAQLAKLKVMEQIGQGIVPALYKKVGSMDQLTASNVAAAAKEGDELAQEIYAMSGSYLGKGLSLLIDILNPERIVIGSIFKRCQSLLWKYAQEEITKESLQASRKVCEVVPAELGDEIGDYAALSLVTYYYEN